MDHEYTPNEGDSQNTRPVFHPLHLTNERYALYSLTHQNSRYVSVPISLIKSLRGNANAAVFISSMIDFVLFLAKAEKLPKDDWFYCPRERLIANTGLGKDAQLSARSILKKTQLLIEQRTRQGTKYKIHYPNVAKMLAAGEKSSWADIEALSHWPVENLVLLSLSQQGRYVRPPISLIKSLRGNANAAVLLTAQINFSLFLAQANKLDREGWFYRHGDKITTDTGLGLDAQRKARRILNQLGFQEEKLGFNGLLYRINCQEVTEILINGVKKTNNLDVGHGPNRDVGHGPNRDVGHGPNAFKEPVVLPLNNHHRKETGGGKLSKEENEIFDILIDLQINPKNAKRLIRDPEVLSRGGIPYIRKQIRLWQGKKEQKAGSLYRGIKDGWNFESPAKMLKPKSRKRQPDKAGRQPPQNEEADPLTFWLESLSPEERNRVEEEAKKTANSILESEESPSDTIKQLYYYQALNRIKSTWT